MSKDLGTGVSLWNGLTTEKTEITTEGWAVIDAGPKEDEKGYHVVIDYNSKSGKEKSLYISFTAKTLAQMLNDALNDT